MSVIQQVYFANEKYSIYIKGIKPDGDTSGTITINGNPTRLERKERYHIEGDMLYTNSYQIPINYVFSFLLANDCTTKKGEQTYVIFKEVLFEPNEIS